MKKYIYALLIGFMLQTPVQADGELSMKGFTKGMSFGDACRLLASFGTPKRATHKNTKFTVNQEKTECGYSFITGDGDFWNIGGKTLFTEGSIKKNETGGIKEVKLGSPMVDELFEVSNMTVEEFSQSFIDNYSWIDGLATESSPYEDFLKKLRYSYVARSRSAKYGWSIAIGNEKSGNSKNIVIVFFESVKPKFD